MKKISVAPENPQYRIVEIFESLQGEGWNTGMPAVFVRLGKCNLACGWCDTDYLKFSMMSLSDILGRLKTYTARNIIITGGEPTIQPHLDTLLDALHYLSFTKSHLSITDSLAVQYGQEAAVRRLDGEVAPQSLLRRQI